MILMAVWFLVTFNPANPSEPFMDGPYPYAKCQRLADTSVLKFCKSMLPDKPVKPLE
jgi:hypothetical protein